MFDDDLREPPDGDWVKGPISARSTPAEINKYISRPPAGRPRKICADNSRRTTDLNFRNRPRDRAAVLERAAALLEPRIRADVEAMHARLLGSVQ